VIRGCIAFFFLILICAWGYALPGINEGAIAAVHVLPHESRGCNRVRRADFGDVCDVIFNEASSHVDVFPVFFEVAEFQALDFGLTWPGTYSAVWTGCSDIDVGDIVWPGDCVSQVWRTCQAGPVAIPGFAEIDDAGQVCVIPHSQYGVINIMDCAGEDDICQHVYCAGIGGHTVRGPCYGSQMTTWGGIKSLFR
jgi:hypothetical protein